VSTGYVWQEIYGWHDTGTAAGAAYANPMAGIQPLRHFESAESKKRLHELVAVSGLLDQLERLPVEPATQEQLELVHTPEYVARIRAESQLPKGGDAGDGFTPFGQGGYDIACLAAGGAIAALAAVAEGRVRNAYALVRPIGHHALPDMGMGFCIFANIAIAIRVLQARDRARRVAVVDWDVHHGNGTQAIFSEDPSVLTISIHQDSYFPPDSGHRHERGSGAGEGTALNVPLPPGSGVGAYLHTIEQVVAPALRAFQPDLVVVASGFDANACDPLGRMMLTAAGFRSMTAMLLEVAADVCDGRVAFVHEGGYSEAYVPFCGLAVMEELAGAKTGVEDPYHHLFDGMGYQGLQPHQADAIAAAAALPIPSPG